MDNGKEHGHCYIIVERERERERYIYIYIYRGYTGLYRVILGLYWGFIGNMAS